MADTAPEPLLSLDAATRHAGMAAGILGRYRTSGDPDDARDCELHALVAVAMGVSTIATLLAGREGQL